ncbi:MAG: SulP family inorganic anion transporter [Bacteroidota bacterium]|nr:SulP family inorganic anion transporter [Bacteroidota bacterium]
MNLTAHLSRDIPASIVVFLVALPLCLGIALASGAPLFSGLIAGIVGGIIVGSLSGSHVSVSGPAAGLTVIVLNAISDMGAFDLFLATVVVAGVFQLILGILKAGVIGYYFPTAVIRGMLAAIGLILILKQIPHALGYDADPEGDQSFIQPDQENTFSEILNALNHLSPGAMIICAISLSIILLFESSLIQRIKPLSKIPGALVAVVAGVGLNELFILVAPDLAVSSEHLVNIPVTDSWGDLSTLITFPNFSAIGTQGFWITALTLAIVASIETLLSIEAADKLDPDRRITPASKELRAQGIGNMVSGFIGGLPVTAVIVRSSANIATGAKTKMSAILHGFLLLALVLAIPHILNKIPYSCLAAVLFFVGYKLTKPSLFRSMYAKGWNQFLPFIITILAILLTDLLIGITIGMVVGFAFIIRSNYRSAVNITERNGHYMIKLLKDVSFLNKAVLIDKLSKIPEGSFVLINGQKAKFIDDDIRDVLMDFRENAQSKNITLTFEGFSNL